MAAYLGIDGAKAIGQANDNYLMVNPWAVTPVLLERMKSLANDKNPLQVVEARYFDPYHLECRPVNKITFSKLERLHKPGKDIFWDDPSQRVVDIMPEYII